MTDNAGCVNINHKKKPNSGKDGENDFLAEKENSPSKLQRITFAKQVNMKLESLTNEYSGFDNKKNTCRWGDRENDFVVENESPPSKLRRVSQVKRVSMKMESRTKENKRRPESDGLLAACKELVKLAVRKGGQDDITVMIIDLNHFKLNSCPARLDKTSR